MTVISHGARSVGIEAWPPSGNSGSYPGSAPGCHPGNPAPASSSMRSSLQQSSTVRNMEAMPRLLPLRRDFDRRAASLSEPGMRFLLPGR
ncbi:hypothetical protein CDD80_1235 [Ophiocordyceps camponoti-rufipedis]|uniref:Uncharacterized protein n=1 Tax=Ophiocordyceps camponoti-rufipedis TaxID=2004952 RepID=A0A2C5Y732_9HYPO|nr:hypothetical protein CDD80_1235 [Ophiocordyceps camponoti-rufipedis]